MKKILLLVVLLTPCVPSLIAGIQSQGETERQRRLELLEPRFQKWCIANGYDYYNMTIRQLDVVWGDAWSETDDFCAAVDSVDSVLNVTNNILNNP